MNKKHYYDITVSTSHPAAILFFELSHKKSVLTHGKSNMTYQIGYD